MDFTREPIVETIITPKEGCKLVVRSSKGVVQDEYFVDAVQVVSYGNAFFFRSIERPKAFLVPVSDYEILEVREARMVLKNVGVDRTIKIGGGREGVVRAPKEQVMEKPPAAAEEPPKIAAGGDLKLDKKRDRRRQGRRRRGRDELPLDGAVPAATAAEESVEGALLAEERRDPPTGLTSILPPPSQLISETLHQYRGNELFKDIFSRSSALATPAMAEDSIEVLKSPEESAPVIVVEEEGIS